MCMLDTVSQTVMESSPECTGAILPLRKGQFLAHHAGNTRDTSICSGMCLLLLECADILLNTLRIGQMLSVGDSVVHLYALECVY